jgi:hypothetical protein
VSSAGYIVTASVRHLAAWTVDEAVPAGEDLAAYRLGHLRAICGMPTRKSAPTIWAGEVGPDPTYVSTDPAWQRQLATAMRRPVCKDCAATVSDLIYLRGGAL